MTERAALLEILRLGRALDAMDGAKETPRDKARYDRIEDKLRDAQAPGFLDKSEEYLSKIPIIQYGEKMKERNGSSGFTTLSSIGEIFLRKERHCCRAGKKVYLYLSTIEQVLTR